MARAPQPMAAEELRGREYDWLGCDARGHVAFCSTAGAGFAPAGLLADVALHEAAIELLLTLPVRSDGSCTADVAKGLANPWLEAMRRGLFAYDSQPNGGPYRQCAVPSPPAALRELPELVQRAALTVSLPHLEFAKQRSLDRGELEPRS